MTKTTVLEVEQPNLAAGDVAVRWRWVAMSEAQKRPRFSVEIRDPGKGGLKTNRERTTRRREPVVDFLEAGEPLFSLPMAAQALGSRQDAPDMIELIFAAQCRGMQPRVLDRESGERPMKRGPIGTHQQIFQASRAAQVFHRKVTGVHLTVVEPGRDAASVVDVGKKR